MLFQIYTDLVNLFKIICREVEGSLRSKEVMVQMVTLGRCSLGRQLQGVIFADACSAWKRSGTTDNSGTGNGELETQMLVETQ